MRGQEGTNKRIVAAGCDTEQSRLHALPKRRLRVPPQKVVFYALLIFFSLIVLYPLVFMLLAGLFTKEEYELVSMAGEMGILPFPKMPTVKNYLALFMLSGDSGIGLYFLNSVIRTVYATFMAVLTTVLCAYVFSRLKFKGKRSLLLILLMKSMMPGTVTLIPTYLMYAYWPLTGGKGILDTWAVYLIGGPAINIMGTFIVKQYLDSVPVSLDESAKIDGASLPRVIFSILLPVAKTIIGYIIITTAIGTWNDWSTAFFFTTSDRLQLLPSAISKISIQAASGTTVPDYPLMITLGLAVTIPALIIYLCFQKYIVEGMAHVGIKG